MSLEVVPWDGDPQPIVDLAREVGWPWTESRVRRVERLQPAMAWNAREDGRLVGSASCFVWPDAGQGALAWIAGMLVRPDRQRRGVGAALLREALAYAQAQGARRVGLDATASGAPLYARHGFRALAQDARWEGPAQPVPPQAPQGPIAVYPISSCEVMELLAYDRSRFGASRAALLADAMARRPHLCFVAFERASGRIVGHVLAQESGIGPLVADTPHAARWLLFAAERSGAPRVAFLAGRNPAAQAPFAQAGWTPAGAACTCMVLGEDLPGEPASLFALGGWGLG